MRYDSTGHCKSAALFKFVIFGDFVSHCVHVCRRPYTFFGRSTIVYLHLTALKKSLPASVLYVFQSWLGRGMYYTMAVEWLSVFPRKQIKFIYSDDWYYNSTKVAAEIYEFLGMREYLYTGGHDNKIQAMYLKIILIYIYVTFLGIISGCSLIRPSITPG